MECAETLEIAAQKNSPVYGDLHVDKDEPGTRETHPCTANKSRNEQTYKLKKVKWSVAGRESEGGKRTNEARTT